MSNLDGQERETLTAHIAQRIREARAGKDWSQEQLATACGWTQAAVSLYEAGHRRTGIYELCVLAEKLERPLAFFLDDLPGRAALADREEPPGEEPANEETPEEQRCYSVNEGKRCGRERHHPGIHTYFFDDGREASWIDNGLLGLAAREEPLTVWTCMSCGHISDGQSCRACGSEAMPERWVREAPTHFEWPEHYEVGETQTTACLIPLDGRTHTSYRKEVTCVACLQTMLAARGDTERPDGAKEFAREAWMAGVGSTLHFEDWWTERQHDLEGARTQ
jgi:transcriptional regulator with XRE-family HTH domain